MPDYFLALNKQYGIALNDAQAELQAKAVVQSWYLSLPALKQQKLCSNLPEYLLPNRKLFFNQRLDFSKETQSDLVFTRLNYQLQKTDPKEIETILKGVFKSLKIILNHQQKFELSRLLDNKLLAIFVDA